MTLSWSDPLSSTELDVLVTGSHRDPHQILGAHISDDHLIIRTFRPHATEVSALVGNVRVNLALRHSAGVFSGAVPLDSLDEFPELATAKNPPDYRLEVRYSSGVVMVDDPYRWLPTLGDLDQHLISEGRHERLWDVLGAHQQSYSTPVGLISGVAFAVWAPSARGVRVAGDFNYWDGQSLPMRMLGTTGVWELFVPGLASGALYKFQILGADGVWREKADPMAFATEVPPRTASKVFASNYQWRDDSWLAKRAQISWHEAPISVYELHIGSWRKGLNYRALADELIPYLIETGFTHVEFLPVSEHPFGGSWGYQVSSYYAPTSRFGDPDDFRYLIDRLHQAGIGALLDWVPAHFPKDTWALARFDGTPLYEHADPRLGEHPDWDTLIFNYGRHEVRNFLVANALYWLEEFHLDGLRVDGVASMLYLDYSRAPGEWVPNEYGGRENLAAVQFLQELNATVYKRVPGVFTIAEESTSWPGVTRSTDSGGLGFGFKWNMGWMNDTLDYLRREPIFRQYHHQEMTFSLVYSHDENFILPLSHDEVVHGKASLLSKMPGDLWQRRATLRALYGYMFAHPGKKLLFMGAELGQETEWSEQRSLDWWQLDRYENRGIRQLVIDLNHLYRKHDALFNRDADPSSFSWLNSTDSQRNVFSFVRYGSGPDNSGEALACVINFAGTAHQDYRVGLPRAGQWAEILNTDATIYGGSGIGNLGAVTTHDEPADGQPQSAVIQLPPLGALFFRYVG